MGRGGPRERGKREREEKGGKGRGGVGARERGWKGDGSKIKGKGERGEGKVGRREGEDMKKKIRFSSRGCYQSAKQCWRKEGGGRRKPEGGGRGEEQEQGEDQKREGGKESGKTEGKIARFTNKVKHRGRETREGWRVHSTTVLPKLPVEGKGVWPRLIRWNGVTPGR